MIGGIKVPYIKWFYRKLKIFLYLLPGLIALCLAVKFSFFYEQKSEYPYQYPKGAFQEYLKDKNLELNNPEVINMKLSDGATEIFFKEDGLNKVIFLDVYYQKKIGTLGLFKSNRIHKCGLYNISDASTAAVIFQEELKKKCNPAFPDNVVNIKVVDIIILNEKNGMISNPVRVLMKNGKPYLQTMDMQFHIQKTEEIKVEEQNEKKIN